MGNLATIVTTSDIVKPLQSLVFTFIMAIASIFVIWRHRFSWWRLSTSVICVVVFGILVWRFFEAREHEANVHNRMNTRDQLNSLNLIIKMMYIDDPKTKDLNDDELFRLLRAQARTAAFGNFNSNYDLLKDRWNRPLFTIKNSSGYTELRSPGLDGKAHTYDDL